LSAQRALNRAAQLFRLLSRESRERREARLYQAEALELFMLSESFTLSPTEMAERLDLYLGDTSLFSGA
jgi:hypothetical protein